MKSEVKRRRLGRTGEMVSELSFGAMNLRRLDTEEEAYALLNYVLDQGINLIDTARAYNGENGQGKLIESEVLVGRAISQRSDLDEPIVVVTKGHGYTPEALREDLTTSRAKLGITSQGDLRMGPNQVKLVYFLHGINLERWQTITNSGVLKDFQAAKDQGLVTYLGFSSHYRDTEAIEAALDTGIFDVVELPYNVYNRSLGEDGDTNFLEYAFNRDVGIINMKAFNGNGMPPIYRMIEDFVTIDYPAMLNFCLSNPYITTVDAGARFISEFQEDIAVAMGERLAPQELAALKAEADKIAGDIDGVCRECMHCLEKFSCSQDVDFPKILALYSRHTVADKLGKDTAGFAQEYSALSINADDCIECGECMPWCEYKLEIPEMLKRAHDVFTGSAGK